MTIQSDQLISLGYGRFVRSDEVVAIEPIIEERGPGRRTLVWVRGLPEPLTASRSEKAITDDLLTRADDAAHLHEMRGALRSISHRLGEVPAVLRRIVREESGVDVEELAREASRVAG
ncbi:MAG: hypothetical protein OEV40_21715 [Acidimicrobiia bacterium]|nr:hypothetical protein [Acidimicrobiia bacterium]